MKQKQITLIWFNILFKISELISIIILTVAFHFRQKMTKDEKNPWVDYLAYSIAEILTTLKSKVTIITVIFLEKFRFLKSDRKSEPKIFKISARFFDHEKTNFWM